MTQDAGDLAYRPMQAQDALPIWSDGDELVFSRNTRFPPCCIKCGAASSTELRKTLVWHPQWLYVLILFPGWLIYLIVALAMQKKAEVALPLCQHHHDRRRRWMVGAWSTALLGLCVMFAVPAMASSNDHSDLMCAGLCGGFGLILAALVGGIFGARVVYPTHIDDQTVRVKGAGRQFLAMAPPLFR